MKLVCRLVTDHQCLAGSLSTILNFNMATIRILFLGDIVGEPGRLPGLTGLFFNHFSGALLGLLAVGLGVTLYAARAHLRETDDVVRMSKLLASTCFSALLSVAFLALFVLAAALPAYAKLMQR